MTPVNFSDSQTIGEVKQQGGLVLNPQEIETLWPAFEQLGDDYRSQGQMQQQLYSKIREAHTRASETVSS